MDSDELRHVINSFSFDRCKNGNQGFKRILIQLFGLLGNGKSSFINTCLCVWLDEEYQNWAMAGSEDGASTTERIGYKLTSNISIVDNRGLVTMDGYETGEIFAQLGNLLSMGRSVTWSQGFGLVDRIKKSENLVRHSDFIVPVYVHSVKKTMSSKEMTEMRNLLYTARELTGIYPIVVLTNKNYGHLTTCESLFRDMGIERIFAFENYTPEDHIKTRGRHDEVLRFLQEVIRDVQFRVEHETRNPVKEMQECKHFIMNYVHEREKKMEEENLERKTEFGQAMMKKELQKQEEEIERERQRRRQAEEEDLRRRREEPERQRSSEQARREEELEEQQFVKYKKGKNIFRLFGKKK